MGKHRCKSLVPKLDGHSGQFFFQAVDARCDVTHRLRLLALHGGGFSHYDFVDLLIGDILFDKIDKCVSRHGCKPVGNYLQSIGHGYAATLSSVVY